MAAKTAKSPAASESGHRGSAEIARLLAAPLTWDVKRKTEQVPVLREAGFEVPEVADLLGMTQSRVRSANHTGRKNRKVR